MTRGTNASKTLAAVVFTCMLALGWFSYSPALSGSFTLDDVSNLAELESVDDNVSAIRFMFSGIAGPLGRPLALASFLPLRCALRLGRVPRRLLGNYQFGILSLRQSQSCIDVIASDTPFRSVLQKRGVESTFKNSQDAEVVSM